MFMTGVTLLGASDEPLVRVSSADDGGDAEADKVKSVLLPLMQQFLGILSMVSLTCPAVY